MRSIQSGEKERTDLSGRSGRGHLVLVCAERRRPHLLLQANTLHRHPAAQMGMAKSDFCQMGRSDLDLIKNTERFARIDLDLKKNATIINTHHNLIKSFPLPVSP